MTVFTEPIRWAEKTIGTNFRYALLCCFIILVVTIEAINIKQFSIGIFLLGFFVILFAFALKQVLNKYKNLEIMYREEIKNRNIKVK